MKKKNTRNKEGFAIFAVLFAIAAISSLLAIMMFSGMQRIHMARKLSDRIRAKAIAESGCENAYALLSTDFDLRDDPSAFDSSPSGNSGYSSMSTVDAMPSAFSDETYDVSVVPVGAASAIVSSTGYWGSATATAIIGVQKYGGSSSDGTVIDTEAFGYAILCGGDFDFRGCGTISSTSGVAKLHSNGITDVGGSAKANLSLSSSVKISIGNNKTIDGDVTAPSLDYRPKKVTITGTASKQSVALIEIPDIDLTPYFNYALKNGEVHNGFSTSSSYTPNGGILWVNGDVSISSHAVINGSIIATGNIHVSGAVKVLPTTCAFGLVSRDGDITHTSSGLIKGLVYVKTGNYSQTANGQMQGQLMVNGNIKKGGNSDILVFEKCIPEPPETPSSDVLVGISAWQE